MVCYSPITAWRGRELTARGKRPLVFNPRYALNPDISVSVPCSQCIGCRLEYSRQWAVRCVHEMQLHDRNCFVTLTFSDEYLLSPVCRGVKSWERYSVNKREVQLFMKRLRKRYGAGIRYFACGEYGKDNDRAHYHAILFNHQFDDRKYWKLSASGERLFRSESLESLWPFGYSSIGAASFQTAAYVARYMLKKVKGSSAKEAYSPIVCPVTGEVLDRKPEFATMSQSLGKKWFEQFSSDVYPSDEVVVEAVSQKPPKFYDGLAETMEEYHIERIKRERKARALERDEGPDRRRVREQVQLARLERLGRDL